MKKFKELDLKDIVYSIEYKDNSNGLRSKVILKKLFLFGKQLNTNNDIILTFRTKNNHNICNVILKSNEQEYNITKYDSITFTTDLSIAFKTKALYKADIVKYIFIPYCKKTLKTIFLKSNDKEKIKQLINNQFPEKK